MTDITNGGMDDPVLQAALTYIEKGWPTFPLHRRILGEDGKSRCSCGKPNCRAKGKEPLTLHGNKDATTDEATIRAYLREGIRAATSASQREGIRAPRPRHRRTRRPREPFWT